MNSSDDERDEFQVSLENCQGFSIPIGVGSSFHQSGTVNENVLESDFVPLCDAVAAADLLKRGSSFSA